MKRIKLLVVATVVLGVLLFGAASAHAGWWWNSKVDVEGTPIATIWTVDDAVGLLGYRADITVTVPEEADALVLEYAPNEVVRIRHSSRLECTAAGIESIVRYKVTDDGLTSSLLGSSGHRVDARVVIADELVGVVGSTLGLDTVLGQGSGQVGEVITVKALIPGKCSDGLLANLLPF